MRTTGLVVWWGPAADLAEKGRGWLDVSSLLMWYIADSFRENFLHPSSPALSAIPVLVAFTSSLPSLNE